MSKLVSKSKIREELSKKVGGPDATAYLREYYKRKEIKEAKTLEDIKKILLDNIEDNDKMVEEVIKKVLQE